jgi:CubicO group peptidase (beta-lactamase class C family)
MLARCGAPLRTQINSRGVTFRGAARGRAGAVAAAADAGCSSAGRDPALLLERALRRRTTVALSRAEARELAELVTTGGFAASLALLEEALRRALGDGRSPELGPGLGMR